MKTLNLQLAAILIIILSFIGCKKDDVAPNNKLKITEKSLLWEVSGNGMDKPFHLYGSIHLIEKDKLTFLPTLESILENSSGLVLETDISSLEIAEAAKERMFLPSTISPKSYYTDEQWDLMQDVCDRVNFSFSFFEQVKPLAVTSFVFPNLLSDNKEDFTSYEEELVALAAKYNVKTSGFEEADYVYTYFDSLPLASQYKELYGMMDQYDKEPESIRSEFEELVDAYQKQDIYKFYEDVQEDAFTYDQLIVKRNYHWLTKINNTFAGKLVAVGAGHLAGEQGLLELLRLEGYSIKALN